MRDAGLKPNSARIRRQLTAGYRVISLSDGHSPYRADFIVQPGGRLERRGGTMFGFPVYYQTPEALILAKLRMIKATVSSDRRQDDLNDVRAILENTRVRKDRIVRKARTETTLEIFNELLRH